MPIKNPLKKVQVYWIAFIIPIIVLFFSFLLKAATGPYWQFPDPSYGYLTSSLSLIKGLSPSFNYHPGTPVQIIGGVVMFLFNIGRNVPGIVHQVLLDPDFYLNAINISMIIFIFLSSLILGAYVYHQTNDKMAVLLSQLPLLSYLSLRSYSFYDYVLPVITNVSPEPLLIGISTLFNLFFLKLFFAKDAQKEVLMSAWLGLICGLGIATRITFFPFLLLPLIVCKGGMKFLFIMISAASCFIWTIPIIPHYAWIWKWIMMLSTHKGGYGSGGQGFIDLTQYLWRWQTIWDKCNLLIIFALAAVFFTLVQVMRKHGSRGANFLLATAFCILVQLALTAKHYDDHYLVPSINLFGALFVLFYLNVKNKTVFFKTPVFLCIIIFMVQSLGAALAYNKQLSGYTKDAISFNNMIHAKYPGSTFIGVFPMPLSNPEAALFWGNDRDNGEQDEISNLYPKNFAHFDNNTNDYAPYVSGIYSIKQRVWADDLITSGVRVVFVAPKAYDFSQTPYTVLPLEQGKYEGAYLLVASTEKQADKLFEDSIKLLEAGEYPQAFAFALKANELHYQPAGKVNYLLSTIYLHLKN